MYNNLNTDINLYGEYRLKVVDNESIISDTGWCKNTILSSGLVSLSSLSISEAINYVDFGTSSIKPGAQGYNLNGVYNKAVNNELIDIERDSLQTFTNQLSTKVYVAGYTSDFTSLSTETIREFSIKTINGNGFARNVLPNEVVVNYGQAVNFEYRLSVGWGSTYNLKVPFKSNTNTFYVDTTSKTYNIPYDRVYYNNNKLLLLKNNDSLPSFGDNYPTSIDYTFNNLYFSTFSPATISASINNSTKTMSVYDEYKNISSPDVLNILSPIYTAVLVKDGDINITTNKFLVTRFNYPVYLYNYSAIEDTNLLPNNNTLPRLTAQYQCLKKNVISLCYRYSWSESTQSIPTGISNITQLPTLSANCPTTTAMTCGTTTTYKGNNTLNIYEVIFEDLTGDVSLTFNTNGVPVKFRVMYDNNEVINTGFRGDTNYNGALINLGYDPVVGSGSGILSFNKSNPSITSASIYIDSPISNVEYTFNLSCPL
jgi:hypothetical protein